MADVMTVSDLAETLRQAINEVKTEYGTDAYTAVHNMQGGLTVYFSGAGRRMDIALCPSDWGMSDGGGVERRAGCVSIGGDMLTAIPQHITADRASQVVEAVLERLTLHAN